MNDELPVSTEPTYALWIRLIGQSSPSWCKYVWAFKTPQEAMEAWGTMLVSDRMVIGCCILREDHKP
jgi:hypothetical protein